jgi:hypothetical protein
MSKTEDGREPIDVLYNIEDKVSQLATTNRSLPDEPRFVPSKGTRAYECLQYLEQEGPAKAATLTEEFEWKTNPTLSNLYNSFLVDRDREGERAAYIYQINNLGEGVLDDEQEELVQPTKDPWDVAEITESEYYALLAVREAPGTPTEKDANGIFLNKSGLEETESDRARVGSHLSRLYDSGHLDRTPNKPYRYWLTDKAKDILERSG